MTNDHVFTRGKIVASTGVPNDVFTFWLRSSLIRPRSYGEKTRVWLRFSSGQVRIAAILDQGRKVGLNVDALRALAEVLQDCEQWISTYGLVRENWRSLDDERSRLLFTPERRAKYLAHLEASRDLEAIKAYHSEVQQQAANPASDKIADAVLALMKMSAVDQEIALSFLWEEGVVALFKDGDYWKVDRPQSIDRGLPGEACVLFDLNKIMSKIDWSAA